MKKAVRKIGAGAAALGLAGLVLVWRLASFNQFSGAVDQAALGECAPVSGVAGSGDIDIDTGSGLAYVASLGGGRRGEVLAINTRDPLDPSNWRDVTGGAPAEFEPIAVDHLRGPEGERLFALNRANDAVEIYERADDGAWRHTETLRERRMNDVRDVIAVGARRFYVTQGAHAFSTPIGAILGFLGAPTGRGSILHFNGVAWREAAGPLPGGVDGAAISADGTIFATANTGRRQVVFFDRDPSTGALHRRSALAFDGAPLGLSFHEDGTLLATEASRPLLLSQRRANHPSRVVRIAADDQRAREAPQKLFADDGDRLSAARSAVQIGDALLVGALAESKYLLCNLSD